MSKYLNSKDGVIYNLFVMLMHKGEADYSQRLNNPSDLEYNLHGFIFEKGMIKIFNNVFYLTLSISTN